MDLNNMMPRDILKMLKEKTITIDEVKNHRRYQIIYNAAKAMNLLNNDNDNEVFAASIDYDNIQNVSKQEYYTVDMNKKLKEYVDENKFSGDYNDLINKPFEIISEEVLVHITQAQLQAAWDANPTINGDSSTYIEAPLGFLEDEDKFNYIIYMNNKEYLPNSVYLDTYNEATRLNIEFYRINDEENNIMGGYYGSHYDVDWNDSQTSGIVKIDRPDISQPPVFTSDFKIIKRVIKRIDNQFLDNNLVINGSISFKECEASGQGSTALGSQTKATAWAAHAEGIHTRANAHASHVEGHSSIANGYYSHAEGYCTIASGSSQHVQGKFNAELGNDYAHIVGNGGGDNNRSNCHTLDWNGNAWFAGNVACNSILMTDQTTGLIYRMYIDNGELKTALITDDNQ